MGCSITVGTISIPNGMTVNDVLNQKIANYQANPQVSVILPCDILSIFFNPIFQSTIGDVIAYSINFFAKNETDLPGRFSAQQYADALSAGYKYINPGMASNVILKNVAEGLYIIFGGDAEALVADDGGLATLYSGPLVCADLKLMGAELVQIAINGKVLGYGDLGKALLIIGFSLNEIPLFLKNNNISIHMIAKELLGIADIPMLVRLLNKHILWQGYCDKTRKNAILNILWDDLDFKMHIRLFENVFDSLGINHIDGVVEKLHSVLNATLSQIVVILQGQNFELDDIANACLKTFSSEQDQLERKTNVLSEIFSAVNHPSPSADDVYETVLSISSQLKDADLFSVITHVLHSIGQSSLQIATILKAHGVSVLRIGFLLNQVNVSQQDIASNLNALEYTHISIGQALWALDINPHIIAKILMNFGSSIFDIAQILKSIKVPTHDIINTIVISPLPAQEMMELLKTLGAADQQIIDLLNIVSFINPSIVDGKVSGGIAPSTIPLTISVNLTINVTISDNGMWSANIFDLSLNDGLYTLYLMSGDVVLNNTQLVVFNRKYFIVESSDKDALLGLFAQQCLSTEQKCIVLLELKKSIVEIQDLLNLHDISTLGKILGTIIARYKRADLLTILSDLHCLDAHSIGVLVGEILYALEENDEIQIFSAGQVKAYIGEVGLEVHQAAIALNAALEVLSIPNVQDVVIEIKVDHSHNAFELVVQKDLISFVSNDEASFTYNIEGNRSAGVVSLHDTIMTYDPYNLIYNCFTEDEFRYTVHNLKSQKGEGKIKVKLVES